MPCFLKVKIAPADLFVVAVPSHKPLVHWTRNKAELETGSCHNDSSVQNVLQHVLLIEACSPLLRPNACCRALPCNVALILSAACHAVTSIATVYHFCVSAAVLNENAECRVCNG